MVYESIEVSQEFKNAMIQKVASEGFYNVHLEDVYNLNLANQQVLDYNIGLSLSSLKAVCWTEQLQAGTASSTGIKYFTPNGLTDAKIYIDNQLVNNVTIDNEAVAYTEMNRALGRIFDSNISSAMFSVVTALATTKNKRTSYCDASFLGGVSTAVVSDWGFTSTGVPCNQLTVLLEHIAPAATADPIKWGTNTTASSSASVFVSVLYDSVLSIDVNGAVSIRK